MFQTRLSLKIVFLYLTYSMGFLLAGMIPVLTGNKHYEFTLLTILLAILCFCFLFKKIQLTQTDLIVSKPLWFFKSRVVYKIDKISKIKFWFNTSRFGGPKVVITGRDFNEEYLIHLSDEELKKLVHQLEIRNLIIEKDQYFEKRLQ